MEIAREGCIEAPLSFSNQPCTTLAPFVDPCHRSRPVTGRNGQGFTTLPPSGPQERRLGPTNSPTTNRVINYSIREANFLLLTFTPMLSDQPQGRCEESLVDSCCLPSYEKQESCFSSVQASTVLRSSRIVVRPLLCGRRHKIAIFYRIYEGQSLDSHALCDLSVWSATPSLASICLKPPVFRRVQLYSRGYSTYEPSTLFTLRH